MTSKFEGRHGLVVIRAQVWGPGNTAIVRLAIDTGATLTVLSEPIIRYLGYQPETSSQTIQITTGFGVVRAPVVTLSRLSALNRRWNNLPVISHALVPTALVDGLLGLDFFQGGRLLIDFRKSRVRLD